MPEDKRTDKDAALKALRVAARGQRVLIALDDVWEAGQERALNPLLGPKDTHSRLLVSTRIRRLLTGGGRGGGVAEVDVGVLTRREGVKLLMDAAGLELPPDEEEEPPKHAVEIAELCGLLPLTVAIAGGVVRNHGGLDEDLVAIIRADQLRGEADGVTVEERIIEASLRSLGAERAAVERIFLFLATLPEDASVPKAALDALAPTLVVASAQPSSSAEPGRSGGGAGSLPTSAIDLARMRHQLHTRLNRLVQLSLVRGSAHEGNLTLHDLVREPRAVGRMDSPP